VIAHLVVSSGILVLALVAAAWVRPLTARTRYAILVAGLASLLVPSMLITEAIERSGAKVMMPLRAAMPTIVTAPAAPPAPASLPWKAIGIAVWLAVAAALFLRSLLVTHRLVANALRAGGPPPARTIAALEAARRRLSLRTSVDLIASPLCEAPAVLRVLRPIIVLPTDGCEPLADDELESLLCHECAHVARRDNLVGLLESLAGSLFWFNPLVWLARRRVASAREEACDERVTDAAMPAETYVGALAKLCRSLVAPRLAAVSCMANAHLKERIEHLMRYDTLRGSALSHRLTTAASAIAVAALIFTGGIVAASPGGTAGKDRFIFNFSIARADAEQLVFHTEIVDTTTKERIGETTLLAKAGVPSATEITRNEDRWRVEAMTNSDGSGTLTLIAWIDGAEVQRTRRDFSAEAAKATAERTRTYSGSPISLNLGGADIRDVLKVFGQLTGLEIEIAPEVEGRVSANFTDVPWDEALDRILRENGYTYRLEGKKLRVFRPGS
jgi:beta-lactamase regulating signal transducer with metallopeptidase domain